MEIAAPVWVHNEPVQGEDFMLGEIRNPQEKNSRVLCGWVSRCSMCWKPRAGSFAGSCPCILIAGGLGIFSFFSFSCGASAPHPMAFGGHGASLTGEYGASVPVIRRRTGGDLARDFNRMSQALAETTVSKDYCPASCRADEPLIIMEPDTTIKQTNPALSAFLGYEASEVVGKSVDLFMARKERSFGETEQGMRVRSGSVRIWS